MTPSSPAASPASGGESGKLLRQGLIYSLSSAAPILVTLVVTPALTRTIDAAQYGVVGLGLVIIQVGLVVLGLGLQEPVARHGIMGASGIPGARSIVLRSLGPSFLLAALAAATSPWWMKAVLGASFNTGYLYAFAAAWLFSVIASIQGVMRAQDRPLPLVVIGLIASLAAPSLGLAIVALNPGSGGAAYLLGIAAGYAVAVAVALVDFSRGGSTRGHPGDFRRALALGLTMMFHQSAVYLAVALCVAIASRRLGVGDAGRMQLSLYVASAPAIIAVALSNSWSPLIYRAEPQRREELASTLVADVAKVIAVLSGGLIILLPLMLPLLMPPSYDPLQLVPAASLAAMGAIFFVTYLASVHLMMAEGRTMVLPVIVPVSIALTAVALVLVPANVAMLAAGFPLATLLMALGTRIALPRVSRLSWALAAVKGPILAVVATGALGAVLPAHGWWLGLRLLIAAAIGLAGLRYLRSVLGSPQQPAPAEPETSDPGEPARS